MAECDTVVEKMGKAEGEAEEHSLAEARVRARDMALGRARDMLRPGYVLLCPTVCPYTVITDFNLTVTDGPWSSYDEPGGYRYYTAQATANWKILMVCRSADFLRQDLPSGTFEPPNHYGGLECGYNLGFGSTIALGLGQTKGKAAERARNNALRRAKAAGDAFATRECPDDCREKRIMSSKEDVVEFRAPTYVGEPDVETKDGDEDKPGMMAAKYFAVAVAYWEVRIECRQEVSSLPTGDSMFYAIDTSGHDEKRSLAARIADRGRLTSTAVTRRNQQLPGLRSALARSGQATRPRLASTTASRRLANQPSLPWRTS